MKIDEVPKLDCEIYSYGKRGTFDNDGVKYVVYDGLPFQYAKEVCEANGMKMTSIHSLDELTYVS